MQSAVAAKKDMTSKDVDIFSRGSLHIKSLYSINAANTQDRRTIVSKTKSILKAILKYSMLIVKESIRR